MNTIHVKQGDTGDTRVVTLHGIANLTGATVRCPIRKKIGGTRAVLAAAVLDGEDRTVEIDFGDDEGWLATAAGGSWALEYEVTFPNEAVLTWPSDGKDEIIVDVDNDA